MSEPARIEGIDHVAIVVRSIEESLPRYRDLFGLDADAIVTMSTQRVRLCFLRLPAGGAGLELIEPMDGESGVARFLASRGEGLHHVCFRTDDLPRDLELLLAHEAELIDRAPREGAHGQVAFIHPRTLNAVLWELLERPQ
ncbi:MAG: VOC family protein [Chloroflexota bacterium]